MPPLLLDARARAADASSSALLVTVSLASLAEIHYAVFPIPTAISAPEDNLKPASNGDDPAQESVDHGLDAGGERSTRGEGGTGAHGRVFGCGIVGGAVHGTKTPAALNETQGLEASGMIPSMAIAGMLAFAGEKEAGVKATPSASAVAASTTASVRVGGKSKILAASRLPEADALEVEFRVDGLQAAQAYSVCLFTETSESNGFVRNRSKFSDLVSVSVSL